MTVGVRSVKCFSNRCRFTPTRAPTVLTSLGHLSYDAATQRSVAATNCLLLFLALKRTLSGQLRSQSEVAARLALHQGEGGKGPSKGTLGSQVYPFLSHQPPAD